MLDFICNFIKIINERMHIPTAFLHFVFKRRNGFRQCGHHVIVPDVDGATGETLLLMRWLQRKLEADS